jgi:2-amino-4-hydroxy-6-hydroxymethyldihydropteridine diphosphokinase
MAYISLGSNLGDKAGNIRGAISALTSTGDIRLVSQSRLFQTEPVDFAEQDWFMNAVIKVETRLAPLDLLKRLQAVQRDAGRTGDRVRFGPRVLDLDILLFNETVMDLPVLCIPHPRMHLRRFVLIPLCDIDPTVVHPVLKRDVRSLLKELSEEGQEVVEFRCSG